MLKSIYIQNFVLIDKVNLDIGNGFNIITGETGSGKSIIFSAINLLRGERSDSSVIRKGEEQATIIGVFDISSLEETTSLKDLITNLGLSCESEIIIKRIITRQKSKYFINDQPIPLQTLKLTTEKFFEIHNQFDDSFSSIHHQSLLDLFCRKFIRNFADCIHSTQNYFYIWQEHKKKLQKKEHELLQKKSQKVQFEQIIKDLGSLNLRENEESLLLSEREEFSRFGKIQTPLENTLKSFHSPQDILKTIFNITKNLERFIDFLPENLQSSVRSLDSIGIELQDCIEQIQSYLSENSDSLYCLQEIDEKLYILKNLSKKYTINPDSFYNYLQEAKQSIASIESADYDIEIIKKDCEQSLNNYLHSASKLHDLREEGAKKLTHEIKVHLPDLKMPLAQFQVNIQKCIHHTQHYTPQGFNRVEFEVSMNPGHPFTAFNKTASGGEISRLKLILRLIFANIQSKPCIIFDEIDAGVSGSTSSSIGQKIKQISDTTQIICITHSPQVAAYGNQHYVVKKYSDSKHTFVEVKEVQSEEQIYELALLISGLKVTNASLATAKELIQNSKK